MAVFLCYLKISPNSPRAKNVYFMLKEGILIMWLLRTYFIKKTNQKEEFYQ